ncbi:MAG: hypothetical protein ACO3L1_06295, partial [Flavobacteriaceae bacterium]
MNKLTGLTLSLMTFLAPSLALSETNNVTGKVQDHYTTVYDRVKETQRRCWDTEVPVYGYRERQGNAAGGALLGMIIGGAVGKGLTGKGDGAAAGAVVGGLIGADQGSKTRQEKVIIGYEKKQKCADEVIWVDQPKQIYSHSSVTFWLDGRKMTLRFNRY